MKPRETLESHNLLHMSLPTRDASYPSPDLAAPTHDSSNGHSELGNRRTEAVGIARSDSRASAGGRQFRALGSSFMPLALWDRGRVAERLNAPVLKTGRPQSRVSPGCTDSWLPEPFSAPLSGILRVGSRGCAAPRNRC
jgi:hypothetical protein